MTGLDWLSELHVSLIPSAASDVRLRAKAGHQRIRNCVRAIGRDFGKEAFGDTAPELIAGRFICNAECDIAAGAASAIDFIITQLGGSNVDPSRC